MNTRQIRAHKNEHQPDLKLVYSAKKKVKLRETRCKRAEIVWENRFW